MTEFTIKIYPAGWVILTLSLLVIVSVIFLGGYIIGWKAHEKSIKPDFEFEINKP